MIFILMFNQMYGHEKKIPSNFGSVFKITT